MFKRVLGFVQSEDGAVTVDWVVLTAAVVALGGAAYTSIQGGSGSVATNVSNVIGGITPDTGM